MIIEWIGNNKYKIQRYFVPTSLNKKLQFIRKHFRVMHDESIPEKYRIRKNPCEYAEVAVMTLARLNSLMVNNIPIIVGSGYLSPKPWGVFGKIIKRKHPCMHFSDFDDIVEHYRKILIHGSTTIQEFNFRLYPFLPDELSNLCNYTDNFIVSLSLNLLYDLLMNCGPDCKELADLYNNDIRITTPSIDEWEELRCKTMGRSGRLNKKHSIKVGQICNPPVPMISTLKFQEISNCDNIALGETVKTYKMPETTDYCLESENDDSIIPPEINEEYQNMNREQIRKYTFLGLNNPSWCQ